MYEVFDVYSDNPQGYLMAVLTLSVSCNHYPFFVVNPSGLNLAVTKIEKNGEDVKFEPDITWIRFRG